MTPILRRLLPMLAAICLLAAPAAAQVEAVHYLQQAEIALQQSQPLAAAQAYIDLGAAYYQVRQTDSATKYYEKALALLPPGQATRKEAEVASQTGIVYLRQRYYLAAIRMITRSIKAYETLGMREPLPDLYLQAGQAAFSLNQYDQAERWLLQAVQLAEKQDNHIVLTDGYRTLASIAEIMGQKDKLIAYNRRLYDSEKEETQEAVGQALRDRDRNLAEIKRRKQASDKAYQERLSSMAASRQAISELKDSLERERALLRQEVDSLMAVKALQGSLIAEQQLQMAEQDRALTLREEALDHQRTLLATAVAVLLFIGGLLFYTFRLYQDRIRQSELLARQKDAIEAQRNEIEATALQLSKVYGKLQGSLNYAQRIQRAILPSLDAMRQALPNSFVLFQPREAVSGDFYWFAQKGQKTFLAAIDCTGHGVPGAFMSMIGYALLNEIVVNRGVSKPSAILQFLDMGIRSALRQEGQGPHDGMDMALCCWDRQQHTLQFAGARNPLVYRHEGRLQVVKGDRFSIGQRGTPKSHRFTNHEIPLNGEPMQVFLYSDGFQDQFGGKLGEKYLSGRFRKLLDEMAEQPARQRQALLQQELDRWMEGHAQVDDILVVGFEASSDPLPQAPAQALAATGAGQA